ncbi:hypothetical protein [Vogesella sp. XCS3]|uniref:hypothetical protein n=1 Tax=Vogesella sp. XCS3 TaxID=2877939 RepID=UPI001D09B2A1|nr:hypothetical protein [Vogesella sp. XCS3]UDM18900.1 hypothetical protein LCH97_18700 [Vogesella sp. XCS3]
MKMFDKIASIVGLFVISGAAHALIEFDKSTVAKTFSACDMVAVKKTIKLKGVEFNGVRVLRIEPFDTPEENVKGLQLAVEVTGKQKNPAQIVFDGMAKQAGKSLKANGVAGKVGMPGYQVINGAVDDGAGADFVRCIVKR